MRFAYVPTFLFLGFAFSLPHGARATTWQVGPTRTYVKPSQVMGLVKDGDTVVIDAATYSGDVGVWSKNNLVITTNGEPVILDAAGKNAQGKAIWVIDGKNTYIENITFTGATVPDQNGAGIRQEGAGLTLRHCYFHDNEDGVLTNVDTTSDIVFEACEFGHNGFGDGYSHNMYIGHVHSFTLRFCYSHDANEGHLVKSRAKINHILFNRLTEENASTSYDIDLPNGGESEIVGNVIHKRSITSNPAIIRFGEEGATNPGEVTIRNNTIVSGRNSTQFVLLADGSAVSLKNNIFAGAGTVLSAPNGSIDSLDNSYSRDTSTFHFRDPNEFDYRLTVPLADIRTVSGATPDMFYVHPLDSGTLSGAPTRGAFPLPGSESVESGAKSSVVTPYPNPVVSSARINIPINSGNIALQLIDESGRIVNPESYGFSVNLATHELKFYRELLPSGVYYFRLSSQEHIVAQGKFEAQ